MPSSRLFLPALFCLLLATGGVSADPLPGWRDGAHKTAILGFIDEVTTPGGRRYVRPAERIAVFGHEGVLLPEVPQVQGTFTLQRLRAQSERHPEWQTTMPFRGALALNSKFFHEADTATVLTVLAATHSGLTQPAFSAEVRDYWRRARHPVLDARWADTAYRPMLELLALLRANGFRTFIVTASNADFVRAIAEDMYGILPEQVIGTELGLALLEEDGQLRLRRNPGDFILTDGEQKVLAIERHIGRRPLLAVGRARHGGDVPMLRYSEEHERPSLQLLLVHDDWEREFAYFEEDTVALEAAAAGGWQIISMRWNWRRVFDFDPELPPAGE